MKRKNIDELVIQERREYFRKWREANKDKVRAHNEAYWQRRAEKRLEEQQKQGGD